MNRPTTVARLVSLSVFTLVASFGCNGLLSNEEGTPRATVDGGASPSADGGAGAGDVGASTCDTTMGNKVCFGLCVKTNDPNTGCGDGSCQACDPKNADGPACKGTASGLACAFGKCAPGFGDCDGKRGNGCEASLGRRETCGDCLTPCTDPTLKFCAPGTNGAFECVASCPPPTKECAGACVNLVTSVENCGTCGKACPARKLATASCNAETCTYVCAEGTHVCGGVCEQDNDPAHCGSMCAPCLPGANAAATCVSNACGTACLTGFIHCAGDPSNACSASCGTTGTCGGVVCGPMATCCNDVCQAFGQPCALPASPAP